MKEYYVLIRCCNCHSRNIVKQIQGQLLPETVICSYCKCETTTILILGPPADLVEALKEIGLAEAVEALG